MPLWQFYWLQLCQICVALHTILAKNQGARPSLQARDDGAALGPPCHHNQLANMELANLVRRLGLLDAYNTALFREDLGVFRMFTVQLSARLTNHPHHPHHPPLQSARPGPLCRSLTLALKEEKSLVRT